jgi:hypothetical protein
MITQAQTQQIMYRLRCTAERDPDDRIANAASQLAFELETPRRVNNLSELDCALIRYAVKKAYQPLKKIA